MGRFWPMRNTLRADCRLFDSGPCAPPSGRKQAEATGESFRRSPMALPTTTLDRSSTSAFVATVPSWARNHSFIFSRNTWATFNMRSRFSFDGSPWAWCSNIVRTSNYRRGRAWLEFLVLHIAASPLPRTKSCVTLGAASPNRLTSAVMLRASVGENLVHRIKSEFQSSARVNRRGADDPPASHMQLRVRWGCGSFRRFVRTK